MDVKKAIQPNFRYRGTCRITKVQMIQLILNNIAYYKHKKVSNQYFDQGHKFWWSQIKVIAEKVFVNNGPLPSKLKCQRELIAVS